MIILLSPAKTLDYSPTEIKDFNQPRFQEDTQRIVGQLKKKSARSLKKLMSISDKLAETNAERYQKFSEEFSTKNAKQAALAFKGDVYLGLEAETFVGKDFEFADEHLRILSGLYGLLRPLDLMQPYRLEMGTRLRIGRKKNLYEFWGNKITDLINEDLENSNSNFLLNLASKEYFKSVNPKKIIKPIINIHFREFRNGKYAMISFNAKKARGKMAQLIIKDQIQDVEMIKSLEVNGYLYNETMSQDGEWFFTID